MLLPSAADPDGPPHRHPNLDLGHSKARLHRGKRSAPGEGQRALRKKAKLLKESEGRSSSPANSEGDSLVGELEDEEPSVEKDDVVMADVIDEEEAAAAAA